MNNKSNMARLNQIIKEPHFVIFKVNGKYTCGATSVVNVFEDDDGVLHCIPAFDIMDVNNDTADDLLADSERSDKLYICDGMYDELFDELIESERADNKGCYFDALVEVLRNMRRGRLNLSEEYRQRLRLLRSELDRMLD